MTPLQQRAQGRWRGILTELGVPAKILDGRHHPCPACGGKDRWRFSDKGGEGTYFCNGCGAGDGVSLVMKVHKVDFREAARMVEGVVGKVPFEKPRAVKDIEKLRAEKNALWAAAKPVEPGDPVDRYLASRGIKDRPPCLRHAPSCAYLGRDTYPAMVAMVTDGDGKPVNLHRTYLTEQGSKADVLEVRKVMQGELPLGSAIRLGPAAKVMGIAEGIETALSAGQLFQMPVWAAINSTLLANWYPPDDVDEVWIFGDNDPKFGGQRAAYILAHRLSCLTRTDLLMRCLRPLKVVVKIHPDTGKDWNDSLLGR